MAKKMLTNKETPGRPTGFRRKAGGRASSRLVCSPYLFRARLRESEDGDIYGDLPDVIKPFEEDGRWLNIGNYFAIYPFVMQGTFKAGLEIDESLIQWQVAYPDVLHLSIEGDMEIPTKTGVAKTPAILVFCHLNGQTPVKLQIKAPSGQVLYEKQFTVIVDIPGWPSSGLQSDVRVVSVEL